MMKYIAFEGRFHQEIIIFANVQEHAQVALNMNILPENILGAGFIKEDDANGTYCYGASNSLGKQSRGDDDLKILDKLLASSN